MLVLALDTATLHLSLALGERGPAGLRLLAEADHPPGTNHSVLLPRALEALLAGQGKALGDLGGLVVGTGPGSFTGLRIGLASAKGLAYALSIPLVVVSSLEAMAHEAGPGEGLLVPTLDARRGEVYYGRFRWAEGGLQVLEPCACARPEQLAE